MPSEASWGLTQLPHSSQLWQVSGHRAVTRETGYGDGPGWDRKGTVLGRATTEVFFERMTFELRCEEVEQGGGVMPVCEGSVSQAEEQRAQRP